jgi:uncharacterized protein (TIGR03382 family)
LGGLSSPGSGIPGERVHLSGDEEPVPGAVCDATVGNQAISPSRGDQMSKLLCAATVAAFAGAASAQDATFTWMNDASGPLGMGDTVRVWVEASWSPDPGWGFASSLFDVVGDDDAYTQDINHDEGQGLGRYFQFSGTFDGTTQGDDIIGIDQFQLPQSFGGGDPTQPIPDFYVFEYTVTDTTPRTVTYTSDHANVDIYQDAFGTSEAYNWTAVPTSFDIIPAPASLALLGLGGLVARRRR